jgi:WD40-like Beta Propeller Repeat
MRLYRVADTVVSVTLEPGPEPRFSAPRPVLVGHFSEGGNTSEWDVSPDGKRFVFTRQGQTEASNKMFVVLHWFERLRAGAATGTR